MVKGDEVLVVVGVEEESCSKTHCHWVCGEREGGEMKRQREKEERQEGRSKGERERVREYRSINKSVCLD